MPCSVQGQPVGGDANGDGQLDIADVVRLVEWLGGRRSFDNDFCREAADANGDGEVDTSDIVALAQYLFHGGAAPASMPADLKACLDGMEALKLRNLELIHLSPSSVMASWNTAQPSTARLRLGLAPALGDRDVLLGEEATSREVLLQDLQPDTVYYYQVVCEDSSGLGSESGIKSFNTLKDPTYNVRREHPRIFFTSEDLPRIRQTTASGGPHADAWRTVVSWCDSHMKTSLGKLVEENAKRPLQAYAFVAAISGETRYRTKAIDAALYLAGKSPGEQLREFVEGMAYVYDWLYGHLSDNDRDTLRDGIVKGCLSLVSKSRDDEFVTGHTHGHNKSIFLGALAVYRDHEKMVELLDEAVDNYRYGFFATWRRFAGSDGGSSKGWWYTSFVLPFELEFMAAWRSATGEDVFQSERIWCEGVLDWLVMGLRGDLSHIRQGDARIFQGLHHHNRQYGLLVAKEYGNAQAQWFAERADAVSPVWGPYAVPEILWRDPEVEPEAPSGPTSRLYGQVGVAILRDSWDPDAALASFRSRGVYTLGHTHRDACSFTLYYKGALALDSGVYDRYGSEHHRNYYTRTVAHNSVTVFDPEEKFLLYGDAYANDGGQRWLQVPEDIPGYWPGRAEDTIERDGGYRLGGIVRYEDTEAYTYVVGNGGPSYSSDKVSKFLRHFLWLKGVSGWDHPVVLVFDDVVSTRPSFRKAYLLHTAREPSIENGWVVVRRDESMLYQLTLAPEDAQVTFVGGRGKEFWVDGKNYPPSTVRENEEPGAWRVEVSPRQERTYDRFLHVLFPADADAPLPQRPNTYVAGGRQVCELGEWVILFDFGDDPGLNYVSSRPRTSHLVFGADPLAEYDVFTGGAFQETIRATSQGTLRFEVEAPGQVQLSRQGP